MIGLRPRSLAWILPHRLAIGERPGGYGMTHRRIRREEEVAWLGKQHFDAVVSLLPGNHNLQAYEEAGFEVVHIPTPTGRALDVLDEVFDALDRLVVKDERKTYMHGDEVDDDISGLCGAYLLHLGLVPNHPSAVASIEAATSRPLGPGGRAVVGAVAGKTNGG